MHAWVICSRGRDDLDAEIYKELMSITMLIHQLSIPTFDTVP
jgi:hypothetical protein